MIGRTAPVKMLSHLETDRSDQMQLMVVPPAAAPCQIAGNVAAPRSSRVVFWQSGAAGRFAAPLVVMTVLLTAHATYAHTADSWKALLKHEAHVAC
jgi:hypothetical protein